MDACLGHIFESTNGIEMKLGLQIAGSERKFIDKWEWEEVHCTVILNIILPCNIDRVIFP